MQESNIRRSCKNSEDARRWCHCYVHSRLHFHIVSVPSYPSVSTVYKPCQTVSNRVKLVLDRVKPCWTVSNRVGPCQIRVGPCLGQIWPSGRERVKLPKTNKSSHNNTNLFQTSSDYATATDTTTTSGKLIATLIISNLAYSLNGDYYCKAFYSDYTTTVTADPKTTFKVRGNQDKQRKSEYFNAIVLWIYFEIQGL